MKLSADIIFSHLKDLYLSELTGPAENAVFPRPEFYMDGSENFESGHLYLATAEHLPRRPAIHKNCALICIGTNMNLNYYRDRLSLILIKSKADFFRVFQAVQEIFDRYDSWERILFQDLSEDCDIQKLLTDSYSVFGKQLTVLDKSFRIVASYPEELPAEGYIGSPSTLSSESLNSFMQESELLTEKQGALRLEIGGIRILCVNIFSRSQVYQGCLFIYLENSAFSFGEDSLAEYLASFIEKAAERNPGMINNTAASTRNLFHTLINELPLSPSLRLLFNAVNRKHECVCLSLRADTPSMQIPFSYITGNFEETFPGSLAFIRDNEIIGFVFTDDLGKNSGGFTAILNQRLRTFLKQMHLYAGISDPFRDLFDIRIHYAQAQRAAENGKLINPSDNLYWFTSYALPELIINSLGGLPAEAYFPAGFRALIEHDRTAGVSYLETLKVFLEENMSYTSAASKLFIHRSTLIDRIARIERELRIDLNDYDRRLLLEILIRAIDIEKMMKEQS